MNEKRQQLKTAFEAQFLAEENQTVTITIESDPQPISGIAAGPPRWQCTVIVDDGEKKSSCQIIFFLDDNKNPTIDEIIDDDEDSTQKR